MTKTKILFLIPSLTQGGAQRHLLDLMERLDHDRYQMDICVLRNLVHFKAELPEGQPRYCFGGRFWASPLAFPRLRAAIVAARPDILHTYLNDGNMWGRLVVPRAHRPRVITSVHLDDMSPYYQFVERRLARRSDRIVAHSRSIQQMLLGLGIEPERIVVIPNGVTPERFHPATPDERRAARAAYALDDEHLVALMAARISPQKNHDLVVAALAELKRAGALPANFRLFLAGNVSAHAYNWRVRAAIKQAGLGDQVKFLGAVRDMQRLYAATDVSLLPSRTEASPIAALEAMSAGLPLLLSAASNTDGVLLDGQHGWEIAQPSPSAIAESLRQIFVVSAEKRRALGAAGRAHVMAHFTTTRVAQDFTRLYDGLLAG